MYLFQPSQSFWWVQIPFGPPLSVASMITSSVNQGGKGHRGGEKGLSPRERFGSGLREMAMLSRLNSYLESKSGRAGRVVALLIVVLILMTSAFLYQWLDLGSLFKSSPSYRSVTTPLNLVDGDIVWVNPGISHFPGYTLNYSNMSLTFQVSLHQEPDGGGLGIERVYTYHLANESQLALLSTGSEVTMSRQMNLTGYTDGGDYFSMSQIHVTDLLGDGLFAIGDYITFDIGEEPIPEDTTCTIGLACYTEPVWVFEYSFAVSHGEFCTWRSFYLEYDWPWYVPSDKRVVV
jgi:hypothetical protein